MAELPPMPETWPEQRTYIGKLQHIGCDRLIQDILKDVPAGASGTPFHFTIARIVEKLMEENHILGLRDDTTIPQIAWAFRNAIELQIFARFVLKSETNVQRFNNDFFINGQSALRASLELLNSFSKKVPNPMRPTGEQYRTVEEIRQARIQAGMGEEGPLMARTCAGSVGLQDHYDAVTTLTSMLIHPTTFSILKTFNFEVYRD